jgi:catechol 2,3-dioxygenase-like lactoylglutathione lyase family enzyme
VTSDSPAPRISQLGHVGIRCFDVEMMVDFYARVLGLELTDHDPELGAYFLSARPQEEHHELLLAKGRTVPADGRLLQQVSFECDHLSDVVGFYRRLEAAQVRIDMVVSHGNAIGVYFFDPEGNRAEVYWKTGLAARQPFVMNVDVLLDADELMRLVESGVSEFGASGFTEASYREWTIEMGRSGGSTS